VGPDGGNGYGGLAAILNPGEKLVTTTRDYLKVFQNGMPLAMVVPKDPSNVLKKINQTWTAVTETITSETADNIAKMYELVNGAWRRIQNRQYINGNFIAIENVTESPLTILNTIARYASLGNKGEDIKELGSEEIDTMYTDEDMDASIDPNTGVLSTQRTMAIFQTLDSLA
jgi:hypothetical protein